MKAKNMLVSVEGELGAGVLAKDIILHICGAIGTAGGTGATIEFAGSAIRSLSMEGRMSVCNMAIEAGAWRREPGGSARLPLSPPPPLSPHLTHGHAVVGRLSVRASAPSHSPRVCVCVSVCVLYVWLRGHPAQVRAPA